MSADPYSATVRELFAQPAHAGGLDGGQTVSVAEQDVRLELAALADGERVEALRFRAWACPHVIAAAETTCARLEGASITELLEFSAVDLMENLAVPVEKTGRILVLEDAVRSLGKALRDGT
jgi:NifU-like protein involved in Fe-S cluster formation